MSRLQSLIGRLQRFYGALPSPPRDPFALFVWEMLSLRSTPRKRDAAFGALKRLRALTPDAVARTPQQKLEESVALAGPYLEQRLRAVRAGADRFRRFPNLPSAIRAPLRTARRAVSQLPHMSAVGAHRMLLFAADQPVLPVDARVARVAARLGYEATGGRTGGSVGPIRKALASELVRAPEAYRRAYLYLDHHGSATCREADPHCTVCPLLDECPDGRLRTRARLEV